MKAESLPIRKLFVDHKYQRELVLARVEQMANDFRPELVGVLVVSKRKGGTYAVVEGQHRFQAMLMLGFKEVLCLIHEGLTEEEEASIFWRQQETSKRLSPLEKHRAKLLAGDPPAQLLEDAAARHGFWIGDSNETSCIRAVKAMESVLIRHGEDALDDTLALLASWDSASSPNQLIIKGLGLFFARFAPIDRQALRTKLAITSHEDIIRRSAQFAKGAGSGEGRVMAVALQLRQEYNRGGQYNAMLKPRRRTKLTVIDGELAA